MADHPPTFARHPPLLQEPQAHDRLGGHQLCVRSGLRLRHPHHHGLQTADVPGGRYAPGAGAAPHVRPFHLGALPVQRWAGHSLVLRPSELHPLQRGLPQRAPRLPLHPLQPPARGQAASARVLRQPALPLVLDEGPLGFHLRQEHGAARPRGRLPLRLYAKQPQQRENSVRQNYVSSIQKILPT